MIIRHFASVAYTFGGARDIWDTKSVSMAIGSDVTFYSKPSILDRLYGDNPVSWKLFVRIRPGKMDLGSMHRTMHRALTKKNATISHNMMKASLNERTGTETEEDA
jgi:hypothetical protein